MSHAIRIERLNKAFGSFQALTDITLDIPRGQTTAIIGPSGSGKSVLVKHVVGLLEPDSGHIWIDDIDMAEASPRDKRRARKRFGMLFQGSALFDNLSAGENVAFPLKYTTKLSEDEQRKRAEEMLALVDLPEAWDRPTAKLSGGQRKRVGLARAIVTEPEIVVFDEPNSGLDPVTSNRIDELILRMQKQLGITFIVVTHDIVQAVKVADRIAMLDRGCLVQSGTVDELLHTRDPVVRAFLGRNIDLPALEPNPVGSPNP
jgi:phospholipid/cholesterol/gamma-HCH transport system ATP-binding protein